MLIHYLTSSCVIFLISVLSTLSLSAQEQQVPFDTEGRFVTISPDQERRLNLFPEYPNFIQAKLFLLPDSSFVLEVLHFVGDSLSKHRIPMNLSKLTELRKRLILEVRKMIPDMELQLAGVEKTGTALANTVLGLGYGFAGIVTSSQNTPNLPNYVPSFVVPILYCGGSIWITSQPWFNRSSLVMLENGLTLGTLRGVAWAGMFRDNTKSGLYDYWLGGMVSGIAEASIGVFLADKLQWNYGQASLVAELGTAGMITGIGSAALFSNDFQAISVGALLGSGLGMYTSSVLSQGQNWANGDGLVFGALSPMGVALPAALTLLGVVAPPIDARAVLAVSLLTHAGSYALGGALINKKDFSFYQGSAIAGATSLGLLAGLGTLLIPDGRATQYALGLSVLGGAVGFAISYSQYAEQAALQAKDNNQENTFKSHSSNMQGKTLWYEALAENTKIEISPLGLLSLGLQQTPIQGFSMPIMSIRYSFKE